MGETRSSGTGACGAAVAYLLAAPARAEQDATPAGHVTVELDGGELEVQVDADLGVALLGWALPVFEGCLDGQLLAELRGAT